MAQGTIWMALALGRVAGGPAGSEQEPHRGARLEKIGELRLPAPLAPGEAAAAV